MFIAPGAPEGIPMKAMGSERSRIMGKQRSHGDGGIEKIGEIYYFTYYNLNRKQVRRSSKSTLKSVAIEMLQKAHEELRKGAEPGSARKTTYEDVRAILIADYLSSGKATIDEEEALISGAPRPSQTPR
jgi:hypothetical protein